LAKFIGCGVGQLSRQAHCDGKTISFRVRFVRAADLCKLRFHRKWHRDSTARQEDLPILINSGWRRLSESALWSAGIVHVIRNHLRWRDATAVYGPPRRSATVRSLLRHGASSTRTLANLATESGPPDRVMIDSAQLKAHRSAASRLKRGDLTPSHRPHA